MIPYFTFYRTPRIIFGAGSIQEIGRMVSDYGNNVLLVTGKESLTRSGKLNKIVRMLEDCSISFSRLSVHGEPSPELVDDAVSEYRGKGIDVVVAIGGGSVVDAGKAISAMLPHDSSVVDYLEGIGGSTHSGVKVPFIAVPTTSGTGSEATKNAVLSRIGDDGFKRSLRHENFVPDVALIDPELIIFCPPDITAACGMDAFTQLLESYVSPESSFFTDTLAYSGMGYLKDNLIPACTGDSGSIDVRASMAYASLISGITLANAGLGIVHGFASAIGGIFSIPHGVICGTLLAPATRKNIAVLRSERSIESLVKFARIGALLEDKTLMPSDDTDKYCDLLISTIDRWTEILHIPLLREYGITEGDLDRIIGLTGNKNNPVQLGADDMRYILSARL
jgi:alcohol dehydrogenase